MSSICQAPLALQLTIPHQTWIALTAFSINVRDLTRCTRLLRTLPALFLWTLHTTLLPFSFIIILGNSSRSFALPPSFAAVVSHLTLPSLIGHPIRVFVGVVTTRFLALLADDPDLTFEGREFDALDLRADGLPVVLFGVSPLARFDCGGEHSKTPCGGRALRARIT